MRGGNLQTAIENGHFSKKPVLVYNIIFQICKGLSYLHSNNILHRDIKSSNVLLETTDWSNPKIKLGDFGLSCLIENNNYTQSINATGVGDVFYRSPEAAKGKSYGKGDDNWAVGIIGLELVSSIILSQLIGTIIFSQYKNFDEYVENILEDYCCSENKTDNNYYDCLKIIIKKLLEKDPDKRLTSSTIIKNTLFRPKIENIKSEELREARPNSV